MKLRDGEVAFRQNVDHLAADHARGADHRYPISHILLQSRCRGAKSRLVYALTPRIDKRARPAMRIKSTLSCWARTLGVYYTYERT